MTMKFQVGDTIQFYDGSRDFGVLYRGRILGINLEEYKFLLAISCHTQKAFEKYLSNNLGFWPKPFMHTEVSPQVLNEYLPEHTEGWFACYSMLGEEMVKLNPENIPPYNLITGEFDSSLNSLVLNCQKEINLRVGDTLEIRGEFRGVIKLIFKLKRSVAVHITHALSEEYSSQMIEGMPLVVLLAEDYLVEKVKKIVIGGMK